MVGKSIDEKQSRFWPRSCDDALQTSTGLAKKEIKDKIHEVEKMILKYHWAYKNIITQQLILRQKLNPLAKTETYIKELILGNTDLVENEQGDLVIGRLLQGLTRIKVIKKWLKEESERKMAYKARRLEQLTQSPNG